MEQRGIVPYIAKVVESICPMTLSVNHDLCESSVVIVEIGKYDKFHRVLSLRNHTGFRYTEHCFFASRIFARARLMMMF